MTTEITSQINNIIETDMADIACLLDSLASRTKISEDTALSGLISAIKSDYIGMWNKLNDAVDALPEAAA